MQALRDILGLGALTGWLVRFLDADSERFLFTRKRRNARIQSEDEKLVASALRGHAPSMDALIRRLKPAILKVVRLVSDNRQNDDVFAGKIFLRVFGALKLYRCDHSLDEWAAQTAIATALHEARNQGRPLGSLDWDEHDVQMLNQLNDHPEKASPTRATELLDRLLNYLTPSERLVKRLRDLDGDSIEAICQWTGWSETKVARLLDGGEQKVNKMLAMICGHDATESSGFRH